MNDNSPNPPSYKEALLVNQQLPASNRSEVVLNQPTQFVVVQVTPQQTRNPCQTFCEGCNAVVMTRVAMEAGSYAMLCSGIICLLGGGLCCLCLIPCCSDSFQDAVHFCPTCDKQLGICKP